MRILYVYAENRSKMKNKNDHSHLGWISEFQIETNKWVERASVTFYMNILIGRVSNNANQTYVA